MAFFLVQNLLKVTLSSLARMLLNWWSTCTLQAVSRFHCVHALQSVLTVDSTHGCSCCCLNALSLCQCIPCSVPSFTVFVPLQIEALILSANSNLRLDEIEDTFQFPLDDFQRQAVSRFLAGKSVLVCAPTGAGKTAIAEAAAVAVLARCAAMY